MTRAAAIPMLRAMLAMLTMLTMFTMFAAPACTDSEGGGASAPGSGSTAEAPAAAPSTVSPDVTRRSAHDGELRATAPPPTNAARTKAGPPPIALSAGAPKNADGQSGSAERNDRDVPAVEIDPGDVSAQDQGLTLRLASCSRVVAGIVCDIVVHCDRADRYLAMSAEPSRVAFLLGDDGVATPASEVVTNDRPITPQRTTIRLRKDEPLRVRYLFRGIPLAEEAPTIEIWLTYERLARGFRFNDVEIE